MSDSWYILGLFWKQADFCFQFVEGQLVRALREGLWILLDEINLAPTDTLQRLTSVLEGGKLTLVEKGDLSGITPHSSFRIIAAMNPPTDVGKKNLPPALRAR